MNTILNSITEVQGETSWTKTVARSLLWAYDATVRKAHGFFNRQLSHFSPYLEFEWHTKRMINPAHTLFDRQVIQKVIGMEELDILNIPYSEQEIDAIFEKIVAKREPGINFDRKKLVRKKITDGICSAVSFFSLRYLLSNINPQTHAEKLKDLAKRLSLGAPQQLAEIQAVFNTICVESFSGDVNYNKVQSLANLFDVKLNKTYPSLQNDKTLLQSLQNQLGQMAEGLYCIRILWKDHNAKLEKMGHTMVFLRDRSGPCLFDTGIALIELNPKSTAEDLIKDFNRWGDFDEVRFYKVTS